jgi:hypothetical protein
MDTMFACTVFQVSSDLQFKCEFSEKIQINELNLLSIENTFSNCPKIVHVGLHSVGTYHKKFGCQNLKNKNLLCRVSTRWPSTKYNETIFAECRIGVTRQSIF